MKEGYDARWEEATAELSQRFTNVDYAAVLNQTIRIQNVRPEQHLARFIVATITQFDLTAFYSRYGERGGVASAPEVVLGILLYGYASGVFSSRKLERATYESIPFRYVAAGLHPDHDTIAHFRQAFPGEIKAVLVQVLLLAQTYGVLKLGNVSLDGARIHADVSKSKAVSYKRARELETCLQREVEELMRLAKQAEQDGRELPPNLNIATEITLRQERLANLCEAKQVMKTRAQERYQAEKAAYDAKQREREEAAKRKGKPFRRWRPSPSRGHPERSGAGLWLLQPQNHSPTGC